MVPIDSLNESWREAAKAQRWPLAILSCLPAPLRLCVRPPAAKTRRRRGVSLMEVLISTFVLSIGLLGLASLLPVGRFAIVETGKADRAGACGRAGLRDVKVRRILDSNNWAAAPGTASFAIDPLGAGLGTLGPLDRISLSWPAALIDHVFVWQDDLVFHMPKNVNDRPSVMTGGLEPEGYYSWFVTVTPAPGEAALPAAQKQLFSVSVVVCYRRDLDASGEQTAGATISGGYGGGTVNLDAPVEIKEDEWIMLCDLASRQCHWYRVVACGRSPTDKLSVTGPDWNITASATATAVAVKSVVGVYTTTVELDRYSIWDR